MNIESEQSKAQRFARWPRWKRWLANVGILDRHVLLMSYAERQQFKTDQVRRLAARPLWAKWLTIAGLATAAISVVLYPYLVGHLTIGWKGLGLSRTIVPSEEPVLFIATLLFFECLFVWPLYFLTKLYFFSGDDGGASS